MIKKSLTRRSHFLLAFLVSLMIYGWLIVSRSLEKPKESNTPKLLPRQTSISVSLPRTNAQSSKLVLLWTDLFHDRNWHQPAFFNASTPISCSENQRCHFTRDREQLAQASAVAFHLYDSTHNELPERHASQTANQTWVFITGESPVNFYYQNPTFFPRLLDNYFDQSISYRHDSPYPIFSGQIKARPSPSIDEARRNRASLKNKTKPIVWMVSNCATFSEREKYVKELRKFIPIDIFGSCGKMCPENEQQQCKVDLNDYYFYLAFENSRCNSYITEKFWKIISDDEHRLVPIVLGAEANDYARIAPKQSYIHVDTYQTPKNLARYLHSLIEQPEEYLRYLQWREQSQIEPISPSRWGHLLCPLCQMAYQAPRSPSTRLQFSSSFNPTVQCQPNDREIFNKCKQATLKVWMSWIHSITCP